MLAKYGQDSLLDHEKAFSNKAYRSELPSSEQKHEIRMSKLVPNS
jgi:hypothetical protein